MFSRCIRCVCGLSEGTVLEDYDQPTTKLRRYLLKDTHELTTTLTIHGISGAAESRGTGRSVPGGTLYEYEYRTYPWSAARV